jgi:hypothetical protein
MTFICTYITKDNLKWEKCLCLTRNYLLGLGRSYALLLASRGAKVVVNDLGGSRLTKVEISVSSLVINEYINQ